TREATQAEAAVPVEALVLDRDERLGDVRRQIRERDRRAPLLEQLGDELAVVAQDASGLLGLPDVDLRDGRAVAADGAPGSECEAAEQREHDNEAETGARREARVRAEPIQQGARVAGHAGTHRVRPTLRGSDSSPFESDGAMGRTRG